MTLVLQTTQSFRVPKGASFVELTHPCVHRGWLCGAPQDLFLCAQAGWSRFVRTRIGLPHIPNLPGGFERLFFSWIWQDYKNMGSVISTLSHVLHVLIVETSNSRSQESHAETTTETRESTIPKQGVCKAQKPEDRKWPSAFPGTLKMDAAPSWWWWPAHRCRWLINDTWAKSRRLELLMVCWSGNTVFWESFSPQYLGWGSLGRCLGFLFLLSHNCAFLIEAQ